jgi:hypothetical protein
MSDTTNHDTCCPDCQSLPVTVTVTTFDGDERRRTTYDIHALMPARDAAHAAGEAVRRVTKARKT